MYAGAAGRGVGVGPKSGRGKGLPWVFSASD